MRVWTQNSKRSVVFINNIISYKMRGTVVSVMIDSAVSVSERSGFRLTYTVFYK